MNTHTSQHSAINVGAINIFESAASTVKLTEAKKASDTAQEAILHITKMINDQNMPNGATISPVSRCCNYLAASSPTKTRCFSMLLMDFCHLVRATALSVLACIEAVRSF